MTGLYYGLELRTGAKTASQVFVNGISRLPQPPGSATAQSLAIHHEVLPGLNTVTVFVAQDVSGLPGRGADVVAGDPELYAKLVLQRDRPLGRTPEAGAEIEDVDGVEWISQQQSPAQLPARLDLTFTAPSDLPPPVWASAAPSDPVAARDELDTAYSAVAAALSEQRFAAYGDLLARRYDDMARAYPLGPDAIALRRLDMRQLSAMAEQPGFAVRAAPPHELTWRAEAGGRLLVPQAHRGASPLSIHLDGEEPMPFTFGFSRIRGVIAAVR